jgi:hypothetical protein
MIPSKKPVDKIQCYSATGAVQFCKSNDERSALMLLFALAMPTRAFAGQVNAVIFLVVSDRTPVSPSFLLSTCILRVILRSRKERVSQNLFTALIC